MTDDVLRWESHGDTAPEEAEEAPADQPDEGDEPTRAASPDDEAPSAARVLRVPGQPARRPGRKKDPGEPAADEGAVQAPIGHQFETVPIQEFHDTGLLWLANRALHPFGYALSVSATLDELGEASIVEDNGIRVVRTSDPLGIVFSERQENDSRARFFAFLRRTVSEGGMRHG